MCACGKMAGSLIVAKSCQPPKTQRSLQNPVYSAGLPSVPGNRSLAATARVLELLARLGLVPRSWAVAGQATRQTSTRIGGFLEAMGCSPTQTGGSWRSPHPDREFPGGSPTQIGRFLEVPPPGSGISGRYHFCATLSRLSRCTCFISCWSHFPLCYLLSSFSFFCLPKSGKSVKSRGSLAVSLGPISL